MPLSSDRATRLADLRGRIRAIEQVGVRRGDALPFGLAAIDARLADGGIARGAVHEVAGARIDPACEAASLCFVAGIAGRLGGTVLWVLRRRDLFAPGLAQAGLPPDRVLYAEAGCDAERLAVMEEGLRHGALAGVVGEVSRAGLAATRRLQLAAEGTGATALLLRGWRQAEAAPFSEPSAALTRWTLAPLPSAPLPSSPLPSAPLPSSPLPSSPLPASPVPVAGIGRARWALALVRQRGGEPFALTVEANDATGRLALAARIRDRADPADRRRAAA